jgi:hypothetical protein
MEPNEFDKNMAAAAFAQSGEHDTARQLVETSTKARVAMHSQKKSMMPMLAFGVLSLTGYVLLIKNQQWVTETYTKGGINTIWPIGTAFLFSFIHGAFASNFLSFLGLEAKKH